MLFMSANVDDDMGEGLLEIDGPLGLPQDMLYNRATGAITESFLSEQHDNNSGRAHTPMVSVFNEVCDTESQTSKQKRPLENADSTRSRKSSRSAEETSVRAGDGTTTMEACGERSGSTKSHVQRVRPTHLCQECGKTFKRAHNLKIHGRLHSGDRPYACPFAECNKEFRWKSSIVSHMNWHRTKKGDVLPGEYANMHALIMKKKKKTGPKQAKAVQAKQEKKQEQEQADLIQMGEISPFGTGLGEVGLHYEGVPEKEETDDATVLTPSTTSYQTSPVGMEMGGMGELDCLPVLEEKEWETRSEGGRSGLSGVLLPSLSSCRIENDGDGFGRFLEDN